MTSCLDRVWLSGGYVPKHVRGGTSPLLIVRVRTLRLYNGLVTAFFSNRCCQMCHLVQAEVLPNESPRPRRSVGKWRHHAHAIMTHRCLQESVAIDFRGHEVHLGSVRPIALLLLLNFIFDKMQDLRFFIYYLNNADIIWNFEIKLYCLYIKYLILLIILNIFRLRIHDWLVL